MAAVRIDSRNVFREVLAEARAATEELRRGLPDLEVLDVVDAQLEFMDAQTRSGATPAREDQLRTSLGPIAVRDFEEVKPAYASLLKELDYAFRRYGVLP